MIKSLLNMDFLSLAFRVLQSFFPPNLPTALKWSFRPYIYIYTYRKIPISPTAYKPMSVLEPTFETENSFHV